MILPEQPPRLTRILMGAAVLGIGVLVVLALVGYVTPAALAMAVMALAAAVLRALSPRTWQIGSRSRAADIGVLVVFGVALAFLALTTPLG